MKRLWIRTSPEIGRRERHEEGFTLVEAMIAASVMLGALLLLAGTLINMSQSNNIAVNATTATGVIASVMEDIRRLEFDELLVYEPPDMPGLGDSLVIQVSLVDADGGLRPTPVAGALNFPNPVEVRVSAVWRDKVGRLTAANAATVHRR